MSNLQQSLLKSDLNRGLNRGTIRAILGDGNGRIYDDINPNSGYCWVQQQTSNGYSTGQRVRGPYQGAAIQMMPGNPVILKLDTDGQLFIAGPDFQGAVSVGSNPNANNASDENATQWTNQSSIVTLVSHCTAPPSLSVVVRGWMAIQNLTITWFNGGTIDLTSFVPSAGNQCLVTVVIKSDFTTLAAYASTAKDSTDVLTVSDLQEGLTAAAAVDSKAVPIWAWRLHDAQTTITDNDSWLDYRQMINLTGISTADLSPAVILAPATSSRNTIQPTADVTALIIKNKSGQTVAPFLMQDSGGNNQVTISSAGHGFFGGSTAPGANTVLTADQTFVDPSTTTIALRGRIITTYTGSSTAVLAAAALTTDVDQSGGSVTGGATPQVRGLSNDVVVRGTANTVASAAVWTALLTKVGAGTLTAGYGIYLLPFTSSGGTFTTAYGIFVDNQTVAGTNYALYTNSGLVRFGDIVINTSGIRNTVRVVTAAGAITVTNADYTIEVNKATGAATTVNLPAGVTGQTFCIKDGKGDANTNNITITPAAGNIDNAGTYVINVAKGGAIIQYDGTQWIVLAKI